MVDLFLSKDEKLDKMEKKLASLERKMSYNFSRVEESIDLMKKVVVDLQTQNSELRKDRDFLLSRYKNVLRKVAATDSFTALNDKFVTPIKSELKESADLIREITVEGLYPESKTNVDSLFELVMNRKRLTADRAAKELGVDEKKVKYWALRLEKQGLIRTQESLGKTVLMKK